MLNFVKACVNVTAVKFYLLKAGELSPIEVMDCTERGKEWRGAVAYRAREAGGDGRGDGGDHCHKGIEAELCQDGE